MNATADILIVGGGIAGISLAAALPRNTRVILAESEAQCAVHASGRSAQQMQPSYGPSQIRSLTAASISMLSAIASELNSVLLRPRPLIWFARDGHQRAIAQMMRDSPHLERLDNSQLTELNPALRVDKVVAAALDSQSFEVDVRSLVGYFARTAGRGGLELRVNSPVTHAVVTKCGWEVRLGNDTLTVGSVVNAGGAWGDEVGQLFGAAAVGIKSYRRTVALARPRLRQVDPTWSMASDIASTLYFRPHGEDILMSPSDETLTPPCDVQPDTRDLDAVRERINEMTDLGIDLITRSWSGLRTFAPDHLPVVGFDPVTPNFYWLVGQGGYGIQTAAAMANLAAADLLGATSGLSTSLGEVMQSMRPGRIARI